MRKIKRKTPSDDERELKEIMARAKEGDGAEIIRRGKSLLKAGGRSDFACAAVAFGYAMCPDAAEKKQAMSWIEKADIDKLERDEALYYFAAFAKYILAAPKDERPDTANCHAIISGYAGLAFDAGRHVEAFDAYNEAWRISEGVKVRAYGFSNILLTAQYLDFSSADLFELHAVYDTIFSGITPYTHDLAARREEIRAGRKIRVGYISPDFRGHVVSNFSRSLLEHHDRSKFEIFCYSLAEKFDETTDIIKAHVDHFSDVLKLEPEEISAKIYADGIDILFDLAGHTGYSGLPSMAYKPAPVQISGIGYLATTGLKAIDYFVTDAFVDPPGAHEKYFVEKLLYLPNQFCYTPTAKARALSPDGAPCKKKGFVTFGVFNQYRKITDEMLGAWLKIMNAAKNSRMILKGKAFNQKGNVRLAKERMEKIGFDLSRIVFEPVSTDYMKRYLAIDIALDTYPYTGGGTTCDALYMGVPVVTLYGERRNTRFSYGLLAAMGLGELAADHLDEYVGIATALANDADLLDELHRKIRPAMLASVVGSPEKYTRAMEEQYEKILGLA